MGKPFLHRSAFPRFLSPYPGIFLGTIYAKAVDHKIPGPDARRWNQRAYTGERLPCR